MKIISDFKDYYDNQLRKHEDNLVFFRRTVKHEDRVSLFNKVNYTSGFIPGYVYICGEFFPFLRYGYIMDYTYHYRYDPSFERNDTYSKFWNNISIYEMFNSMKFEKLVDCPIYSVEGTEITEYPNLHLMQFEFKMDAYTLAIKIRQYLSNIANPEPFISEIDNKAKIESHGFNKYSFRKDKKVT